VLLQTLVSLAIVASLAGAILTSTLVAAKVALHERAAREVQLALARGTNEFTVWAADFVQRHHADGQWPVETTMHGSPGEAISFRVTGSTTAGPAGSLAGPDVALNLETAVDEQRVAGEVTASVRAADGSVVGSGTRDVTLRVFDAAPWAVVTGIRDVGAVLGSVHAAQGDTGGVDGANADGGGTATPDPSHPAADTDTRIRVTMTCVNSDANADQAHPFRDNWPPGNNGMPWGVQAVHGAYEAPCVPEYGYVPGHGPPTDAELPHGGEYSVGSFAPATAWSNGSATSASAWVQ